MQKERKFKCMFPQRVNKDMILSLPAVECGVQIVLVEDEHICRQALEEIAKERLLGFDTETKPAHRAGEFYHVSILQLATENKAWIFRLAKLTNLLPEIFKILEDENILKVGVGMKGDIRGLQKLQSFSDKGFTHIEPIVDSLQILNTGLRNLTAVFFGLRLSKSAQMSNWAANELTQKQLDYAATDAWISRKLFVEIQRVIAEKNFIIQPDLPPEEPPFSFRRFVKKCLRKIAFRLSLIAKGKPQKNKGGKSIKISTKRRGNFSRKSSGSSTSSDRTNRKNFQAEQQNKSRSTAAR